MRGTQLAIVPIAAGLCGFVAALSKPDSNITTTADTLQAVPTVNRLADVAWHIPFETASPENPLGSGPVAASSISSPSPTPNASSSISKEPSGPVQSSPVPAKFTPVAVPYNDSCPQLHNHAFDGYRIECGIDHYGGDFDEQPPVARNLFQCLAQCDLAEGCVAVAFKPGERGWGDCYRKNQLMEGVPNGRVVGAVKIRHSGWNSSGVAQPWSTTPEGFLAGIAEGGGPSTDAALEISASASASASASVDASISSALRNSSQSAAPSIKFPPTYTTSSNTYIASTSHLGTGSPVPESGQVPSETGTKVAPLVNSQVVRANDYAPEGPRSTSAGNQTAPASTHLPATIVRPLGASSSDSASPSSSQPHSTTLARPTQPVVLSSAEVKNGSTSTTVMLSGNHTVHGSNAMAAGLRTATVPAPIKTKFSPFWHASSQNSSNHARPTMMALSGNRTVHGSDFRHTATVLAVSGTKLGPVQNASSRNSSSLARPTQVTPSGNHTVHGSAVHTVVTGTGVPSLSEPVPHNSTHSGAKTGNSSASGHSSSHSALSPSGRNRTSTFGHYPWRNGTTPTPAPTDVNGTPHLLLPLVSASSGPHLANSASASGHRNSSTSTRVHFQSNSSAIRQQQSASAPITSISSPQAASPSLIGRTTTVVKATVTMLRPHRSISPGKPITTTKVVATVTRVQPHGTSTASGGGSSMALMSGVLHPQESSSASSEVMWPRPPVSSSTTRMVPWPPMDSSTTHMVPWLPVSEPASSSPSMVTWPPVSADSSSLTSMASWSPVSESSSSPAIGSGRTTTMTVIETQVGPKPTPSRSKPTLAKGRTTTMTTVITMSYLRPSSFVPSVSESGSTTLPSGSIKPIPSRSTIYTFKPSSSSLPTASVPTPMPTMTYPCETGSDEVALQNSVKIITNGSDSKYYINTHPCSPAPARIQQWQPVASILPPSVLDLFKTGAANYFHVSGDQVYYFKERIDGPIIPALANSSLYLDAPTLDAESCDACYLPPNINSTREENAECDARCEPEVKLLNAGKLAYVAQHWEYSAHLAHVGRGEFSGVRPNLLTSTSNERQISSPLPASTVRGWSERAQVVPVAEPPAPILVPVPPRGPEHNPGSWWIAL